MEHVQAAGATNRFIFRGNSSASGGYLTRLDGNPVRLDPGRPTVHGESSVSTVGGISHSIVEKPDLPFAPWITYGRCETRVEASAQSDGSKKTAVFASVSNLSVKTRPSESDKRPGIREITLVAATISVTLVSVHPAEGQPRFTLPSLPVTDKLALRVVPADGDARTAAFELNIDHPLVTGYTLDKFEHDYVNDEKFFERYRRQMKAGNCSFREKPPRNKAGYIVTSIVQSFTLGGKTYDGNEYSEPGFGKIRFGELVADGTTRRLTMVQTEFGSDPAGASSHGTVDTNGMSEN